MEELAPAKGSARSTITSDEYTKPEKITSIVSRKEDRIYTDMKELNRVLGGGIVKGSLVLIGGDPGIGKSTLLLQTSAQIAKERKVLYISGEESVQQTKLRADRLGVKEDNLYVLAETNVDQITHQIKEIDPGFVAIDSIQTVFKDEVTSAPGSVSQVRECTMEFMRIAKSKGIPICIV